MFLKLSDIYALRPHGLETVTEAWKFEMSEVAFPELAEFSCNHELYEFIIRDERFTQAIVAQESRENYRYWTTLRTFRFDGKPFAIMVSDGKDVAEVRERFITDPEVYREVVHYVRSTHDRLFPAELADQFSPEDSVPAELLFSKLPATAAELDITFQARNESYFPLERSALPSLPLGYIMVGSKEETPPAYLRNWGAYFQRRELLTEAQCDENPSLLANFTKLGYPHVWTYLGVESHEVTVDCQTVVSI